MIYKHYQIGLRLRLGIGLGQRRRRTSKVRGHQQKRALSGKRHLQREISKRKYTIF